MLFTFQRVIKENIVNYLKHLPKSDQRRNILFDIKQESVRIVQEIGDNAALNKGNYF